MHTFIYPTIKLKSAESKKFAKRTRKNKFVCLLLEIFKFNKRSVSLFCTKIFLLNIICKRLDESGEQSIMLAHKSEEIIDAWMDGINMLINPRPTTNIACLVECLIDTQLLDLNSLNFEIPAQIPSVPPLPADFDFNFNSSST